MNRILPTLLLVMLAFSFSATSAFAESKMGFRLTLGSTPGIDHLTLTDSLGTTLFEGGIDAEDHVNFNPAFVYRSNVEKPIGFVGLAGIFVRHHAGEDEASGLEAKLTALGVNLSPGMAVRLAKRAHLEFRAELGLGSGIHDIGGVGTDFEEGSGTYVSIGATAGVYFHLGRVVELGLDVGYLDFESDGEVDDFFETYDTEMSGSGTTFNASIGFMF